jgi:hypothetical protein
MLRSAGKGEEEAWSVRTRVSKRDMVRLKGQTHSWKIAEMRNSSCSWNGTRAMAQWRRVEWGKELGVRLRVTFAGSQPR